MNIKTLDIILSKQCKVNCSIFLQMSTVFWLEHIIKSRVLKKIQEPPSGRFLYLVPLTRLELVRFIGEGF